VARKQAATGQTFRLDMTGEVRSPGKRIRSLGADNFLVPLGDVLEHPERCAERFSPERWSAFKSDVTFFRIVADKAYWEGMQQDHNPPPAWTILGSSWPAHRSSTRDFSGSFPSSSWWDG
jgi:hypothetical protein